MTTSPSIEDNNTLVAPIALEIEHVSKTFGAARVLKDITIDVRAGEVHAVVGHNGSGKSTLVKILSGFHQADPDPHTAITVGGEVVHISDSSSALDAGLRFVHQDLGLVPTLNTIENMALGRGYQTGFGGRVLWRRERERCERLLAELGLAFDVTVPVAKLQASQRTSIAVARALDDMEKVKALVLDEPTATLPNTEVSALFDVVRHARDQGIGIIYISHRLDEIFAIADRVTVLRDGTLVDTLDVSSIDTHQLVDLMVGGADMSVPHRAMVQLGDKIQLTARDLCGEVIDGIDLDVRAGEILGIAGLTGSGRDELLSMLFGARPRRGTVTVGDTTVRPGIPRSSIAAGIAFVPPERVRQALFRENDLTTNCTITDVRRFRQRAGWLSRRSERGEMTDWIGKLDIRPARNDAIIGRLSGGNQQKVVLARWLRIEPKVLLLDEPTQGVDVSAKASIHHYTRTVADTGAGVIVASSDEDELCDLCDRIVVLRDGKVAGELVGDEITTERIIRLHQ